MHLRRLALVLALEACGRSQAMAPVDTAAPPAAPPPNVQSASPAPPAPDEWPITIRNASKRPIVLETSGCNGEPAWLALRAGADRVQLRSECACEQFPEGICPMQLETCYESKHEIIAPGASYAYRWSADRFVTDPERGCGLRRKLRADQPIEVEVCWLEALPDPESREPGEPRCMMARSTLAEPGALLTVTL